MLAEWRVKRFKRQFGLVAFSWLNAGFTSSTGDMRVLRGLGRFPRTPYQQFIPEHMYLGPRTRSQVTIWSLPEEVVVHLLKGLHITDLLNMRLVHPYFKDLIDNSTAIWSHTSFKKTWPSAANIKHFERAAKNGNIGACVKLGVAYLYNEGLPGDIEGNSITNNGEKAAEMFCRVESLVPHTSPFTWLFIRPPWSLSGACCKECVFTYMKGHLDKVQDTSVMICVAKTLALLDDEDRVKEAKNYLTAASQQGSTLAAFLLWKENEKNLIHDAAGQLDSIRRLRGIAKDGELEAQLALCKSYVQGRYGGIDKNQAADVVQHFVQSSKPSDAHKLFRSNSELKPSMRYILVDWLVEVAGMKDFSSQTLHVAINVVDRYLSAHKTSRSKLQLVGVAAMVISSRYLDRDIITIREAAWLTDDTYTYDDVVRMMGEISATLKGNFRVCTSLDYVEIFTVLVGMDNRSRYLSELFCELTLLHAEMGQYTAAQIGACSILLARLTLKEEFPWPQNLEEFSGFSIKDLLDCASKLHRKCLNDRAMIDHRELTLQSVKQRYSDDKCCRVGEIKMITTDELHCQLGISEDNHNTSKQYLKLKKTEELIVSPLRPRTPSKRCIVKDTDRNKVSTPIIDVDSILNESAMSGYDGDREDGTMEDSGLETKEYSPVSHHELYVAQNVHVSIDDDDTYFASLSTSFDRERERSALDIMLPSWMSPTIGSDLFQRNENCEQNMPSPSGVFTISTSPRSTEEFSPFSTLTVSSSNMSSPLSSTLPYSNYSMEIDSIEREGEVCYSMAINSQWTES